MEVKEMIERACAGLRRMNKKPDYLLCISQKFDAEKISDIPVLYNSSIDLGEYLYDKECPFAPLWKERGSYNSDLFDTMDFYKGFENKY